MTRLGAVMCEAIVHHYGRDELLRRLAHPFWFQSFGAVMGMDWHSSGITTSVIGALKRGLAPLSGELDDRARAIEHCGDGQPFDALIAEEFRLSHSYGGRSVFGWESPAKSIDLKRNSSGK